MKPYYDHGGITIYHGDCREVSATLPANASIVSDPPYGMGWNTNTERFAGGTDAAHGSKMSRGKAQPPVTGDDEPFNPAPWLEYPRVVLFGSNHYAQRLPVGTTLVWLKRLDQAFGSFLSDAEIAWMKGGHGVYCFRDLSMRAHERERSHPSQKPVPLMQWCIQKAGGDGPVVDPFMGSGTTLVAAKQLGRRAIGIEIEERYCEIAAQRLSQEVLDFGGAS